MVLVEVTDSVSTGYGYVRKASRAVTVQWSHPECVCENVLELRVVVELVFAKKPSGKDQQLTGNRADRKADLPLALSTTPI